MEFKQVYYCKNCQLWHEINPADSLKGCPNCKAELKYVPVKHDIYSSMSSEEKKEISIGIFGFSPRGGNDDVDYFFK